MNISANSNVHIPKLATDWTSRGSDRIPVGVGRGGGAIFSAPTQTGPGAHPASSTVRTRSFRRPAAGGGVNHPPPSSAEVHGRVEIHPHSPSGSSWPVLGRILPSCTPNLIDKDAISLVQTYQRSPPPPITTRCHIP
jgi:hypothetical protein